MLQEDITKEQFYYHFFSYKNGQWLLMHDNLHFCYIANRFLQFQYCMKTRAQLRLEASQQENDKKAGKTKKEILEEKQQKNAKNKGKGQGTKKVKTDVTDDKQISKKQKDQAKTGNKKAQTQKQTQKEDKQQKLPRNSRKRPAGDTDTNKNKAAEQAKVQQAKKQKAKGDKKKQEETKEEAKAASEEKQEVKKFTFKGKVPIDEYCRLAKDTNYQILEYNGRIYSATLNQTSVKNNNNKFYILQVIQNSANTNQCYFFTRWGRVGVPGQQAMEGPFNMNFAVIQYNAKFREKHDKGDYREVQLSYENEDQKKEQETKKQKSEEQDKQKTFNESKLSKPVKKLIELIFDLNMMNKQMVEIGYNVSKMPLGKLSKDNIKRGYNLLQSLADELKGKNRRNIIQQYTDDFYSYIPHDFGFSKMHNFILDTQEKVKKKIEMLQSLAQIKVATNLLSTASNQDNKIDANYEKLKREITEVDPKSQLFSILNKYLQSTHASTHNSYSLEIQDLFELNHEGENIRYRKDIHNKMLLWHGSRLTNFVGILSQGLRIAPPEAPVTGYMFGKGVYFADMSSKSANYCFTSSAMSTGILLLCEVALGNMNEKFHADYYASNLPADKHSTKGLGRTAPDPTNFVNLSDGVVVPMGPGMLSSLPGTYLQYNQFIVYDVAQIKIRYLLRTKFHYKNNRGFF